MVSPLGHCRVTQPLVGHPRGGGGGMFDRRAGRARATRPANAIGPPNRTRRLPVRNPPDHHAGWLRNLGSARGLNAPGRPFCEA